VVAIALIILWFGSMSFY